jgi:hypothetical protein
MPVDQAAIEAEITGGLRNELGREKRPGRLEEARQNDRYYEGDFEEDTQAWEFDEESLVTVRLMRRVIDLLTANLYRKGPERTWPGLESATLGLQAIYQANGADALWQEADRLSLVNQVAAIQVAPDLEGATEGPFRFYLWGGGDLVVWLDSEDPRRPGAVATLDLFDNRRRLRLYTEAERVTFATEKWSELRTAGGTAFKEIEREPNTYGVIPFAFAHSSYPARYFWTPGPGSALRQLNYHVNYRLSTAADDVLHNRPIGVVEGAMPEYQFPRDRKAGEWTTVPSVADAGGTVMGDARASYIVCDFGYLQQDLEQLQAMLDRALEMLGIPAASIRLEQSSTQSGVALMAEQVPLVLWAESRQRPFSRYEQDLARLVARMAAVDAAEAPTGVTAAEWLQASETPLQLKWPEMSPRMPGPQTDQSDQWLLDNQLTSRKRLAMERFKMTGEEADAYLAELAAELAAEASLFGAANAAWQASMMPLPGGDPNAPPQGAGAAGGPSEG